jgi:hypothetical protein
MEIQFTIKLIGSTSNAPLAKKDTGDEPTIEHKLAEHPAVHTQNRATGSEEKREHAAGKGGGGDPLGSGGGGDPLGSGGGGDPLGSGGGDAGRGQVIVIGPIVVCPGSVSNGVGTGGGGDPLGSGGHRATNAARQV